MRAGVNFEHLLRETKQISDETQMYKVAKPPPKDYVVRKMRNKCVLLCQASVKGIGS